MSSRGSQKSKSGKRTREVSPLKSSQGSTRSTRGSRGSNLPTASRTNINSSTNHVPTKRRMKAVSSSIAIDDSLISDSVEEIPSEAIEADISSNDDINDTEPATDHNNSAANKAQVLDASHGDDELSQLPKAQAARTKKRRAQSNSRSTSRPPRASMESGSQQFSANSGLPNLSTASSTLSGALSQQLASSPTDINGRISLKPTIVTIPRRNQPQAIGILGRESSPVRTEQLSLQEIVISDAEYEAPPAQPPRPSANNSSLRPTRSPAIYLNEGQTASKSVQERPNTVLETINGQNHEDFSLHGSNLASYPLYNHTPLQTAAKTTPARNSLTTPAVSRFSTATNALFSPPSESVQHILAERMKGAQLQYGVQIFGQDPEEEIWINAGKLSGTRVLEDYLRRKQFAGKELSVVNVVPPANIPSNFAAQVLDDNLQLIWVDIRTK
jgi:hypothetical protein